MEDPIGARYHITGYPNCVKDFLERCGNAVCGSMPSTHNEPLVRPIVKPQKKREIKLKSLADLPGIPVKQNRPIKLEIRCDHSYTEKPFSGGPAYCRNNSLDAQDCIYRGTPIPYSGIHGAGGRKPQCMR
jgi:hypothetical protein